MQSVRKTAPSRYHSKYPLTDCGNAERLVDQHLDCLRFCNAMHHWFLWKGNHWGADDGGGVQMAKKTVRAMHQERKQMLNDGEDQSDDWEILRRRSDALE